MLYAAVTYRTSLKSQRPQTSYVLHNSSSGGSNQQPSSPLVLGSSIKLSMLCAGSSLCVCLNTSTCCCYLLGISKIMCVFMHARKRDMTICMDKNAFATMYAKPPHKRMTLTTPRQVLIGQQPGTAGSVYPVAYRDRVKCSCIDLVLC